MKQLETGRSGHLAAIVTILMWGTTFIATKVLLEDFGPIEILFYRFVMGLVALTLVYPRRMKGVTVQQNLTFAAAGLCGVTLYYLLENIALTYTLAANVSVIVSAAPFFTGILTHFFLKGEERLRPSFFLGFAVAMTGICIISFQGSQMQVSPVGDILCIIAAFIWAVYSLLMKKIGGYGYHTIQTTRRIFVFGTAFMIPALFFLDFRLGLERLADPVNLGNLIFLGLGASALGFVTWNYAVKVLGPVKTSVYIYVVPVITIITSVIVLKEKVTALSAFGACLTIVGLFLSEWKGKKKAA